MVKNTIISALLLIIATLTLCCFNLNKAAKDWQEYSYATEKAYIYLDHVRMEQLADYKTQLARFKDTVMYTDTTLYDDEVIAIHYVQMATWNSK